MHLIINTATANKKQLSTIIFIILLTSTTPRCPRQCHSHNRNRMLLIFSHDEDRLPNSQLYLLPVCLISQLQLKHIHIISVTVKSTVSYIVLKICSVIKNRLVVVTEFIQKGLLKCELTN